MAKLSSDESDTFVWDLVQSVKKGQPSPQVVENLLENLVLVMPDHARVFFVKRLIEEEVKLTGISEPFISDFLQRLKQPFLGLML